MKQDATSSLYKNEAQISEEQPLSLVVELVFLFFIQLILILNT